MYQKVTRQLSLFHFMLKLPRVYIVVYIHPINVLFHCEFPSAGCLCRQHQLMAGHGNPMAGSSAQQPSQQQPVQSNANCATLNASVRDDNRAAACPGRLDTELETGAPPPLNDVAEPHSPSEGWSSVQSEDAKCCAKVARAPTRV